MKRSLCLAALVLFQFASVANAATLDRLRAFVRETQTARAIHAVGRRQERPRDQKRQRHFRIIAARQIPLGRRKAVQAIAGRGRSASLDLRRDLNQVIVRKVGDALGGTPARCCPATRTSSARSRGPTCRRKTAWNGSARRRGDDAAFTEIRSDLTRRPRGAGDR
jgi:hypothetical protein